MGNSDSKMNFRKAVIQLTKNQVFILIQINKTLGILFICLFFSKSIEDNDAFWSQFWSGSITSIQDIYTLIPAFEIRALREETPSNLAALCFKLTEKIKEFSENNFITEKNQMSSMHY